MSQQFKERIKRSRVTRGITTAGFHQLTKKHQSSLKTLNWDREKESKIQVWTRERWTNRIQLSSKYEELILPGNFKLIRKDEDVLLKERTHETSVEDSAGLFTWCLPLSLSSMPIPSDRNITGKKIKCLSKIHKNVEL